MQAGFLLEGGDFLDRKYYTAYDDRYRQIHELDLKWFTENPSAIVMQTIERFGISEEHRILEIGCGEGRDARYLLNTGYNLLATDVSVEAIDYCRKEDPGYEERYEVLDCVTQQLEEKFAFIYAIAVVHMLVADEDRKGFYGFLREHLADGAIALVCTMGDGISEQSSDISQAFVRQQRIHEGSGKHLQIAGTSYRSVSFQKFEEELTENELEILETGFTDLQPDYYSMMYAVVRKKS